VISAMGGVGLSWCAVHVQSVVMKVRLVNTYSWVVALFHSPSLRATVTRQSSIRKELALGTS
jgi:hypothetical protein